MIITGATASIYARGFSRPRHRVELLNTSSSLDNRLAGETRLPMVNRRGHNEPTACHSETQVFQDLVEPGPSPTFVAQILGQDLVTKNADLDTCRRAYARAAYETPTPRLLRLA